MAIESQIFKDPAYLSPSDISLHIRYMALHNNESNADCGLCEAEPEVKTGRRLFLVTRDTSEALPSPTTRLAAEVTPASRNVTDTQAHYRPPQLSYTQLSAA